MRRTAAFSLVSALIGLMAAIQYQSLQKTEERDTRDVWEVRTQLQEEQQVQQRLYQRIEETEQVIQQYKNESIDEKQETLKHSIASLKEQAGLTEITREGVRIEVLPILEETSRLQVYPALTPELVNRLINELNAYGATDIAVANERLVSVSPVREVNGVLYINNRPLPDVPLEIKVLAKNPERLIDYMEVSQAKQDFNIENLQLVISYDEELSLPEYGEAIIFETLRVSDLEEIGEE